MLRRVTVACLIGCLSPACAALGGDAAPSAALYPPREIDAECSDRYVWLPYERLIIVAVPPTACWSHWLAVPRNASSVEFRPDGVLDIQAASATGEISLKEAALPFARLPFLDRPAAVRYRNRQSTPVLVQIELK